MRSDKRKRSERLTAPTRRLEDAPRGWNAHELEDEPDAEKEQAPHTVRGIHETDRSKPVRRQRNTTYPQASAMMR
jgi:hypothetical protein